MFSVWFVTVFGKCVRLLVHASMKPAVVPQSESTEFCSLAAVAPLTKSTELCSSSAVLCCSPAVALQRVAQRPAS